MIEFHPLSLVIHIVPIFRVEIKKLGMDDENKW
jgi:hypothetical protein